MTKQLFRLNSTPYFKQFRRVKKGLIHAFLNHQTLDVSRKCLTKVVENVQTYQNNRTTNVNFIQLLFVLFTLVVSACHNIFHMVLSSEQFKDALNFTLVSSEVGSH